MSGRDFRKRIRPLVNAQRARQADRAIAMRYLYVAAALAGAALVGDTVLELTGEEEMATEPVGGNEPTLGFESGSLETWLDSFSDEGGLVL